MPFDIDDSDWGGGGDDRHDNVEPCAKATIDVMMQITGVTDTCNSCTSRLVVVLLMLHTAKSRIYHGDKPEEVLEWFGTECKNIREVLVEDMETVDD